VARVGRVVSMLSVIDQEAPVLAGCGNLNILRYQTELKPLMQASVQRHYPGLSGEMLQTTATRVLWIWRSAMCRESRWDPNSW
jgi:hypothetical protein